MGTRSLSRRQFLAISAAGAAASLLRPGGLALADGVPGKRAATKGVVIRVTHPRVMSDKGHVDREVLGQMLDRALLELTGEKSPVDAWAHFVRPDDRVGLKVNTLGLKHIRRTAYVDHFAALADELTRRLLQVVKAPENIIIWDRYSRELERAGFRPNPDGKGIRCLGWKDTVGADKTEYPVGKKKTRFSKVLTEEISALINIPQVKTHSIAGVTGALKNHYGSISNPRDFHHNGCTDPGIPELNALPPVREKTRLILVDALWAVIDQGPGWNVEAMRPLRSILVSTDPVAVDRIILKTIDDLRRAEGLSPVEPRVRFLELAANLGLGEANLDKISLVDVKLG